MGTFGEHVEGLCGGQFVALFLEAFGVAGQGGGIAGDVDDSVRGHFRHGVDHFLVQTFPGRIHHNDIGADAGFGEVFCGLGGVGAEEFRVFHLVSLGVLLGVLDGLGDDLHADHLPGGFGQDQGDGACAAVQVQNRLLARQARLLDGGLVELLGLVVVHLVEGPGGEAEPEAAEDVLNIPRAV